MRRALLIGKVQNKFMRLGAEKMLERANARDILRRFSCSFIITRVLDFAIRNMDETLKRLCELRVN